MAFAPHATPPMPNMAGQDWVKDGTTAGFVADVLEASLKQPVIVDFWATWCGPCKQLGPALEKAVRAAAGAVRLVKIDIDRNPELAQQMRIQSVPAVYAFYQGRPVDGFMGALPESQVKQFIDRLAKLAGAAAAPEDGLALALAEGEAALTESRAEEAKAIFAEILSVVPDHAEATVGLARACLALGDTAAALQIQKSASAEVKAAKGWAAIETALELSERSAKAGPLEELRAQWQKNPTDPGARYALALALFAAGDRPAAVDHLLEIVRAHRQWNDEAARKELVKFFEAMGHKDPLTVDARKRLSTILFA